MIVFLVVICFSVFVAYVIVEKENTQLNKEMFDLSIQKVKNKELLNRYGFEELNEEELESLLVSSQNSKDLNMKFIAVCDKLATQNLKYRKKLKEYKNAKTKTSKGKGNKARKRNSEDVPGRRLQKRKKLGV